MTDFDYVPPSPSELAALAKSDLVAEDMAEAAEAGADHAASIAPVETGAYRSKFHIERVGGEVHVVNDDEGAAAIEFGTEDTSGHHVLAQTADWLEKGGGA